MIYASVTRTGGPIGPAREVVALVETIYSFTMRMIPRVLPEPPSLQMPDFDACPPLTPDTALETIVCGTKVVWGAAVAAPWVAAAIALSALMTLFVGRSAAIGLAVLVLAIVLADTIVFVADPVQRRWHLAGAGLSLVLIWIGCLRSRRRFARQQQHIAALQAERDAVQAKLDREIVWRRAAEPGGDADPAPAADRRHPSP